MEIVQNVLWGRYAISPAERREFRDILRKLDPWTPAAIADLEKRVAGPFLRAERYFWEDAVDARVSGEPVRSDRRRKLEESLVQQGYIAQDRLAKHQALMIKIANREVARFGTVEAVFDEATISLMIAQVDEGEYRVHSLFAPEQR